MTELAVLGLGLSSPVGLTPKDHAFFVPAKYPSAAPTPFTRTDGSRVRVRYAPWIGAHASFVDRCERLLLPAATGALAEVPNQTLSGGPLLFCADRKRQTELEPVRDALARKLGASTTLAFSGCAGFFDALVHASQEVKKHSVVAVAAVDSAIDLELLTECEERKPSYWSQTFPPPGEASAVFLVTARENAARLRLPSWGTITKAGLQAGTSSDLDDEPVDGNALTRLMRELPFARPAKTVVGPMHCGDLRRREWFNAMPRCHAQLDDNHQLRCLELATGYLFAAGGAASMAFTLASFRHQAFLNHVHSQDVAFVWGISEDGTRGAATAMGATN